MRPYVNPFDVNNFTLYRQIVANPAVGASMTAAVPVNARSMLGLLSCQLDTDANAVNRYLEIQLDDGVNVYVLAHSFSAQAASLTRGFVAFPGCGIPSVQAGNRFLFSLPDIPLFLEGNAIRITIVNIQVGDQLSAIRLVWKIWPYEQ